MTSPSAKSMGAGVYALGLATIVLDILAAILCLYSYNFLLKQRNKEFGLYNILGMNKKHIIWVSTLELIVAYLVTIILGTFLSAVLSNFFYLIFVNIIQYEDLNFQLTLPAFVINLILFAVIFLFLELVNI
ncbi:ftsX-like permease family protein [Streptococcus mutans]|nr:ftsX-like permease family protein [Streptococcus mutans]